MAQQAQQAQQEQQAKNIIISNISDFDYNLEPLYGSYGTLGSKDYKITIVKSLLFLQCYNGCKSSIRLPDIYDSFLMLSNGKTIPVKSGMNSIELEDEVNGFCIAHLKQNNSYK